MDPGRFDELTHLIGRRLTRRRLVVRTSAAIVGGVGGVAGLANGAGASRATCRNARKSCTRNAQCCSGHCESGRNLPRGRRNVCSACPVDTFPCDSTCCAAGEACIDGACFASCTPTGQNSWCVLSSRGLIEYACGYTAAWADDVSCKEDFECAKQPGSDFSGCLVAVGDRFVGGRCGVWTKDRCAD